MSIIESLVAVLGSIESDKIAVHEERCITVRNRNADCLRCMDACTSGALAYCGNELAVEPDRCIGCGTCATACPTCVIEIRTPTDEELTASIKRAIAGSKGHPVIVCETALAAASARAAKGGTDSERRRVQRGAVVDAGQIVEVVCLGRIDESALAGIAAYRAHDTTLVCGTCESCPHGPGGEMARSVVESARNLLAAFGSAMPISLVDELPERVMVEGARRTDASCGATEGGVSRRDFLRAAKDGSKEAATDAVSHEIASRLGEVDAAAPVAYRKVGADGALSHFIPSRRVRLYNYLKHVGEPVADTVDSRVIGAMTIDAERCSSCRMCAVFCPTGAIAKLDEDDAFGIVHRPSVCVQCRLCESICPVNAIEVSGRVPIAQFMGRQAVCYAMKKPDWEPSRPASAFDKVHAMLGDDLEMCMF